MAGTNPDFDSTGFVDGIHLAMRMGAPVDSDDQAAFYFPSTLVYAGPVDGEEMPFDPAATVIRQTPAPVKNVPCSIEYFDAQGNPVPFGTVTASRLAILLLDEDYKKVKGCAYVVVGGEKYLYSRTQPPSALFDVGLFTVHFRAEDER